jgi:hypothetical protein
LLLSRLARRIATPTPGARPAAARPAGRGELSGGRSQFNGKRREVDGSESVRIPRLGRVGRIDLAVRPDRQVLVIANWKHRQAVLLATAQLPPGEARPAVARLPPPAVAVGVALGIPALDPSVPVRADEEPPRGPARIAPVERVAGVGRAEPVVVECPPQLLAGDPILVRPGRGRVAASAGG